MLSLSERKNSLRLTFSKSSQKGVVEEAEARLQSEALTTEGMIVSGPQDKNRSTLLPSEERVPSLLERKNSPRSIFSRSKQNEPDREEVMPQTKYLSGEERSTTGGSWSNRSIQFPAEVPWSEWKNTLLKPIFGLYNRQVNHHNRPSITQHCLIVVYRRFKDCHRGNDATLLLLLLFITT
jgi:hypothetical protein